MVNKCRTDVVDVSLFSRAGDDLLKVAAIFDQRCK